MIEFKLLLLVIVANGAALLGTTLFGRHFAQPLDFGLKLPDGKRLFGPHISIRGILLAVAATVLATPLLGLPATHGAIIGFAAMAGDAFSSFVKRRMGIEPGGKALGIDQIPESLLPLLAVAVDYGISLPVVLGLSLIFLGFELSVSQLLYRLRLRKRPH
jgi:CDP-2,3-bis-(O-geranylgeranyl)-sn-glycerol synthase